jgi:hypothetical protein
MLVVVAWAGFAGAQQAKETFGLRDLAGEWSVGVCLAKTKASHGEEAA